MLNHSSHYATNTESYRLILMLRLQDIILWILISRLGLGREMEHDKFLLEFQQCIAMADDVTAEDRM